MYSTLIVAQLLDEHKNENNYSVSSEVSFVYVKPMYIKDYWLSKKSHKSDLKDEIAHHD